MAQNGLFGTKLLYEMQLMGRKRAKSEKSTAQNAGDSFSPDAKPAFGPGPSPKPAAFLPPKKKKPAWHGRMDDGRFLTGTRGYGKLFDMAQRLFPMPPHEIL